MVDKDIILKIDNISKQYRLGLVGTGSISDDLKRWWYRIRGKEDPFLKIGESNDRSVKGTSDYVWALQDIDFEVQRGEVLGIIGKNGAGKSTLLKILSKVTSPTTGEIKTKGRIASLLEVGTGFHGEMTGRENIYLNGAILGMTKKEISSKIDEIIEFSGCQRYIDTPVKRYSSGMRVRLAFAVAAFLEPDILVIDEVLAVGDAEFQKRAIGKMQDISKGYGRTVLFVSHNMVAVKSLCTRAIVLEHGKVVFNGETTEGIEYYLNKSSESLQEKNDFPIIGNGIEIEDFGVYNKNNLFQKDLISGDFYSIKTKVKNLEKKNKKISVRIQFFDKNEILLTTLNTYFFDIYLNSEFNKTAEFVCEIDSMFLPQGEYFIGVKIVDLNFKTLCYENNKFSEVNIINGDFFGNGKIPNKQNIGKFLISHKWKINNT